MIRSGQQKGTSIWVMSFMAFAFFWLVCGELITLHQKAIFGFDPFNQETPFTKTDNSSSKTKTDKGSKFDKFKDQYHFDCQSYSQNKFDSFIPETKIEFVNTYSIFLSQSGRPLFSLRGPPVL